MGELVNLHRMKQRLAREAASATARENRARHGRTAAQKANDQRAAARREAAMDALRRDDDNPQSVAPANRVKD